MRVLSRSSLRSLMLRRRLLALGLPSRQDYPTQIAAERAQKDEMFRSGGEDSPILPSDLDKFLPLVLLPDRRGVRGAGAAAAGRRARHACRCRRRPASCATWTRIGTLEFTLKGQPLKLTAFVEEGSRAAVRAVLGSDERHRDLSGRPLHESRSRRRPASTSSTSTSRITPTATTTPSTTARFRRRRIA